MLAGLEPMSEPRNKHIPQEAVRTFYEGVCAAVASVDARMPCVVGPTPYYKVWNLNSTLQLRSVGGKPMENVIYTFDFFDPWSARPHHTQPHHAHSLASPPATTERACCAV